MTLTLMPAPIAAVIASRPSIVAGILIMHVRPVDLRPELLAPARSSPSVSCARPGATSIETRPSTPSVRVVDRAEDVGRVAHVVGRDLEDRVVDVGAGRGELVRPARRSASPLARAPAKIVGLVVTPTTLRSAMSSVEAAGGDALAREVVEPDADAGLGELLRWGCWLMWLFLLFVRASGRRERFLRGGDDGLGRDAELAEQGLVVGGGAEVLDRHAAAARRRR